MTTEKSIFLDALDIESSIEREKFLGIACHGNPELLVSVCALLREHERNDNPIDKRLACGQPLGFAGIDEEETTLWSPQDGRSFPTPGTLIGPYKLMEQIGEGGFGLVYVADQQEPIRRRVALKIIKPGMESRDVLARFEAERQAIAMMDHPNIARIFDAGVTDSAQPYFVMELVRGIPLTTFCDNHQLDIPERLKIFVTICHALQHAHQKGIIHRDLKPSNVLVTIQDGEPVAKVIDFGIAKAIGQSLTGKTIYTRFASMVGTPAYMSPEQAQMSVGDVDTRSDIYSLGALLYELLTGSTPFTPGHLESVGFDELRRIIREEDPPRPSTRLSTVNNEMAATVASNRRLDPAKLSTSLKRDLDWIVMKSIDKDRNRRYPAAGALAQDVSRFLMDQPVEARPPSRWYRFSKFARRNKAAISTAAMVAGTLILGTAISLWQAHVAVRERDEKDIALKKARTAEDVANTARVELEGFTERLNSSAIMLASGRAHADAERWADAYEAYTQATKTQPKYYLVWLERGRLNAKIGRWREAAADFVRALQTGCPVEQNELSGVPQLLFFAGESTAYELLSEQLNRVGHDDPFAVAIRGKLVGEMPASVAADLAERVEQMLSASGETGSLPDEETKEGKPASKPGSHSANKHHKYMGMLYGVDLYVAGWAHLRAGNYEKAIQRLAESNEVNWFGRGIAHPLLAIAYHKTGRADDAVRSFERSQALLDRLLNDSVSQSKGAPAIPWVDWIELLLNYREASIVVKGHTPAFDPRLREMEAFAESSVVD